VPDPAPRSLTRLEAACGVLGPAAFVGAWLLGGALRAPAYSPVADAISRLAQEGTSTVPLMTAGFVVFGVLVPVYARGLGRVLGSPATRAAATLSGLATLAVAALPLSAAGGQRVDALHAVAAGTGYLGQVLAPLLGGLALRGRARAASLSVSGVAALCLVASLAAPGVTGLFQRTGLTVVDAWFVVLAVRLARPGSPAGRR